MWSFSKRSPFISTLEKQISSKQTDPTPHILNNGLTDSTLILSLSKI
jgi:hypothetical protein